MSRQLGRAFSIIAEQIAKEHVMHEDVSAFGAPSECHRLVARGEDRRAREARRHAKAVSGLSRGAFRHELRRLPRRSLERAIEVHLNHLMPWES